MLIAGIDIGATTTKIALKSHDGVICRKTPTDYTSLEALQRRLGVEWEIFACGVPAPVKNHRVVNRPPNLKHLPSLGEAPWIINDGNAAALGEYRARNLSSESLYMLSFGTGLGGGYIQAGHIMEGAQGYFAEVGHFTLQPGGFACGCGARGCAEQYASSRFFHHHGITETKRIMEPPCRELMQQYLRNVACVINSIINLYDPNLVVIGGGMAAVIEQYWQTIMEQVHSMAFGGRPLPPVESALLGEYAAAHGLLEYARRMVSSGAGR